MKIKEASDKANQALDDAAAKVERAKLTKWILVALAVVLLIAIGLWASKARATGYEHMVKPIIVKPPVVVTPVAPAPVPPSPAAPVEPPVVGGGDPIGPWVMVGVGLFFYAAICQKEREVNKTGWFARNCKPWKDDTK